MSDEPVPEVPVSREEFRQLEARIDERFQAVSARFTTVDRQLTAVKEHLAVLELHVRRVREAASDFVSRLLDTGEGDQ